MRPAPIQTEENTDFMMEYRCDHLWNPSIYLVIFSTIVTEYYMLHILPLIMINLITLEKVKLLVTF